MSRRIIFIFIAAALVASCKKETHKVFRNGQEIEVEGPAMQRVKAIPETQPAPPADGKYPAMTFSETEHDFGTINQGDKVSCSFEFKNTGEANLIISAAKGSCGCTVPEYPKEPIKPGESGEIKVSFNSAGKSGLQHKSVTLTTNTANWKEKLNIKANIKTTDGKNMQPVSTPNK